jgi:hypothetical protein
MTQHVVVVLVLVEALVLALVQAHLAVVIQAQVLAVVQLQLLLVVQVQALAVVQLQLLLVVQVQVLAVVQLQLLLVVQVQVLAVLKAPTQIRGLSLGKSSKLSLGSLEGFWLYGSDFSGFAACIFTCVKSA